MKRGFRCIPCASFVLGLAGMGWTVNVWAVPTPGPLAGIGTEAIFSALITAALLVVSGYTARNDRDMRELRKAMQEQFGAVALEQRQQQTQINLLAEKFGDRPSRQELTDIRLELDRRFDRLESLLMRRPRT